MKRNYIIPFFISHQGCPEKCIFCNQGNIAGVEEVSAETISSRVEKYLETIPKDDINVEIGFFGGTFTGLSFDEQERYLGAAYPFIEAGKVKSIRVSTRPDFITEEKILFLKKYGVKCVELGVQSMDEEVLRLARRGYTASDVEAASRVIISSGLMLGHQIMSGLPGSGIDEEYYTAKLSVELGAVCVRIYPVLVVRDTELARMWKEKKYIPLSENEAVERCKFLMMYFEANNVKVIRCGLHPSEGFLDKSDLFDGPFHVSFRQKVESAIFREMLNRILSENDTDKIIYHPEDAASFIGYKKTNSLFFDAKGIAFAQGEMVPRGSLGSFAGGGIVIYRRKDILRRIIDDKCEENRRSMIGNIQKAEK